MCGGRATYAHLVCDATRGSCVRRECCAQDVDANGAPCAYDYRVRSAAATAIAQWQSLHAGPGDHPSSLPALYFLMEHYRHEYV